MSCKYVRTHYGVPAEIGRAVAYKRRTGIITEDSGHYVGVTFDDEKPGRVSNFHPKTEGLEYGEMGRIRPMTRAQKRYQDYLRVADCFESFAHFLRRR